MKIIKRTTEGATDPYPALLECTNTPTADMASSPAEQMFGRLTTSTLPSAAHQNISFSAGLILGKKQKKKLISQTNYNKSARISHMLRTNTEDRTAVLLLIYNPQ